MTPHDIIHRLRIRANNADARGAIAVIQQLLIEAQFARRPPVPAK
jgi:hypothetical protein